jgi:zinc transport system ATP-binding protein
MEPTILRLNNVYFSYGREHALQNVSFNLKAGELVGIAGPNGAGKTTLLRLISGLIRPTSGRIEIARSNSSSGGRSISYLQQNLIKVDPNFPATVEEVVKMGLYGKIGIFGRLNHSDQEVVSTAIKDVGLGRFRHAQITELSGGQLQRALIARSLVSRPSLLLLDEPTTAVDLLGEEEFYQLIKHVNKLYGIAILLVSHDVYSLLAHTNRLIFINKKILYDGGPRELSSSKILRLLFSHEHSKTLIRALEARRRR